MEILNQVQFKLIHPQARLPEKGTEHAAGYDLCSVEKIVLKSRSHSSIPTGLTMEMPKDMEAQVRPRSGLAARHGVTVLNSPGTIDSDYRGEVKVLLINHSEHDFVIEPGMRIAQMVFSRVIPVTFQVTENLTDSLRGQGGFGSTGFH
jgi:dUTP pyrophosphatase